MHLNGKIQNLIEMWKDFEINIAFSIKHLQISYRQFIDLTSYCVLGIRLQMKSKYKVVTTEVIVWLYNRNYEMFLFQILWIFDVA